MSDPRSPHIPQYPTYPPEDAPRPAASVSPVMPAPYPAPVDTSPHPAPGDPDYDVRLARAKKRVADMRGFYRNLAAFVGVNALMLTINVASGGRWWFFWVTIWWGFSLATQGWKLFGPGHVLSKDWEERKIQEEMRRSR